MRSLVSGFLATATIGLMLASTAADAKALLYSVDVLEDSLVTIDMDSGQRTVIGPLGPSINSAIDLAYDKSTDTLFGIDSSLNALLSIDRSTGAATNIGRVGFTRAASLGYDSTNDALYASALSPTIQTLYSLDPLIGKGSRVGSQGDLGFKVETLTHDSSTDTLYGTDVETDQLIRIDADTGTGTAIGPINMPGIRGIAYDELNDTLFGLSLGGFFSIDRQTGLGKPIGFDVGTFDPNFSFLNGIEIVHEPDALSEPPASSFLLIGVSVMLIVHRLRSRRHFRR